ncbi:hypothetical protein TRFO_08759 [Tritrichomonas foetus]|uniref:Sialidase domain-containing protein n=1 Tax=Tritrichomonas foetus TaxID=1144522 RepID=A0A1J4JHV8_9EUKA|nr:hypothetical protein TRFO_08759 [Tritrichomonas foetus]|eukprot:OHS98746.1 hypothetical protein TRFO_08759 [Tritrichomonas foetus]
MFLFFALTIIIEYLEPYQDWPVLEYETVYENHTYGVHTFREPTITFLPKENAYLLVNDARYNSMYGPPNKIGIVSRKMYGPNRNRTYTTPIFITGDSVRDEGDSGAAIVVDRKTGNILALWSGDKAYMKAEGVQDSDKSTSDNPMRIYKSYSYDSGDTWTPKEDITSQIYSKLCTSCADYRKNMKGLFITPGNGLQQKNGSIVFGTLTVDASNRNVNYLVYSHDFGKTWGMSAQWPVSLAYESKVFEKVDGTLLEIIPFNQSFKFATTNNYGDTYISAYQKTEFGGIGTNCDFVLYTSVRDGYNKNRVLFSYQKGLTTDRNNLYIGVSYDEGNSVAYSKMLEVGPVSSSSIGFNSEGEILVYYDKAGTRTDNTNGKPVNSYELELAIVSLEWLTDGADKFQKPGTLRWCLANTAENEKKCKNNHYKYNYQVFDCFVEKSNVFPEVIEYHFIDTFRNFEQNLSAEGLVTGNYVNEADKIKVTLVGGRELKRELKFSNIDVAIPQNQLNWVDLQVEKGQITVTNAGNANILLGSDKAVIEQNGVVSEVKVPASSSLVVEGEGVITVNKYPSKLLSNNNLINFTVQSVGRKTTVRLGDVSAKDVKVKNCKVVSVADELRQAAILEYQEMNIQENGLEVSIVMSLVAVCVVVGILLAFGIAFLLRPKDESSNDQTD